MNIRDFFSGLTVTATWSVRQRVDETFTTLVDGPPDNRLTLRVLDHLVPIGYPGGELHLELADGVEQFNAALPTDLVEHLAASNGIELSPVEYESGDRELIVDGTQGVELVLSNFVRV